MSSYHRRNKTGHDSQQEYNFTHFSVARFGRDCPNGVRGQGSPHGQDLSDGRNQVQLIACTTTIDAVHTVARAGAAWRRFLVTAEQRERNSYH